MLYTYIKLLLIGGQYKCSASQYNTRLIFQSIIEAY